MKERRGKRKLRLCNTKNYERKKYAKKLTVSIPRDSVSVLPVSIPISLVSFQVSLPVSAFTSLPALTVEILHDRIRQLSAVPEGIHI